MKLLKSERAYFEWARSDLYGWGSANADYMRQRGPKRYPCFGYATACLDSLGSDVPAFLYAADAAQMHAALVVYDE
jgi:hypothetical protein